MSVETGKRYKTPRGVEFIVTRGADGVITDEDQPVKLENLTYDTSPEGEGEIEYPLGKKISVLRPDGVDDKGEPKFVQFGAEALVIRPGRGRLCYDGELMSVLQPKVLPSAD